MKTFQLMHVSMSIHAMNAFCSSIELVLSPFWGTRWTDLKYTSPVS